MRTAKVLDRLKAEQAKNPDVPHYDSMGTPWPQPPSDVKTAGYWKLEGRRPHLERPGAPRPGRHPRRTQRLAVAARSNAR